MKLFSTRVIICAATLLAGFVGTSRADEIVTSVISGTSQPLSNFTYGYTFTVGSSPISVTQLGIWTPTNGLMLDHEVGLWDNSGNLLTSVTVPTFATSAPSGFSYEPVPSAVLLNPNT